MTAVANIQASGSTTNVVAAVKTAAASTGADFDYLLQTAVRESSPQHPAHQAFSSSSSRHGWAWSNGMAQTSALRTMLQPSTPPRAVGTK